MCRERGDGGQRGSGGLSVWRRWTGRRWSLQHGARQPGRLVNASKEEAPKCQYWLLFAIKMVCEADVAITIKSSQHIQTQLTGIGVKSQMKRLWSLQQRNPSTCSLRRRSRYGMRSWTIPRPRSRCRRSPSHPTSAGAKPRAHVWLPRSPSVSFPSRSCCSRLTCRPSSSAPSWRRCCVTTLSRATCRWPCPCWSYWATASVRRSTSSRRWGKPPAFDWKCRFLHVDWTRNRPLGDSHF